jgi:hypothetical protein
MTLDERLRETFESERFGALPPDVDALRDRARARERRRHRLYAGAIGVVVVVLASSAVLASRSGETEQGIITGPVETEQTPEVRAELGPGPGTARNVTSPAGGTERRLPTPWLAARMGVRDTQLVIAYNAELGCPVVSRAAVAFFEDRVEIGLYLQDPGFIPRGSTCEVVGPPHVAVELTEPLAGRPVYDVAAPGVERTVLDGAVLQVPKPATVGLVEERVLYNSDDTTSWMQTFEVPGGTLAIAQGSGIDSLLAVGIDPSDPRSAPRTVEGVEPLSVVEEPYGVHGLPVVAMVYGVREYGPTDIGLLWEEDGRQFALRYQSTQGTPFVHDVILVAHALATRDDPPSDTLPMLDYESTNGGVAVELRSPCPDNTTIETAESADSVTLTARCSLGRFGAELTRVSLSLDAPLGDRTVIDGTTGRPLPARG